MKSSGTLGTVGIAIGTLVVACGSSTSKSHAGTDGNGTPPPPYVSGQQATDTPQGLASISASTADGMINNSGVCQGWASEPESGPATLEFLIDVTTSMTQSTPSTGGQSKWRTMQSVLPDSFAAMPDAWSVGVSFFASQNYPWNGRQAVPIALLGDNRAAINQAIAGQNANGYTPTAKEWQFGLEQLSSSPNPRYLVLITDGVPTVSNDGTYQWSTRNNGQLAISQAEYDAFVDMVGTQGAANGVRTFVVGVPGSEDPQGATYDPLYMLSQLAVAGQTEQPSGCTPRSGTPVSGNNPNAGGGTVDPRGSYCHFDMTTEQDFATGLRQSLASITSQVISCSYTVPPAPEGQVIDAQRINVIYDDGAGQYAVVLPNTKPECDRGWHFTDATNSQIEICSVTCDLLQANAKARLNLVFGCRSGEIPTVY